MFIMIWWLVVVFFFCLLIGLWWVFQLFGVSYTFLVFWSKQFIGENGPPRIGKGGGQSALIPILSFCFEGSLFFVATINIYKPRNQVSES